MTVQICPDKDAACEEFPKNIRCATCPTLRSAIDLLSAVNDRHDNQPPPLKYSTPYGAVNALRDAVQATTLQTAGAAMESADALKELIARQAVEIEQLRKDAERYRWLRANFDNNMFLDHMTYINEFDPLSGDEVDAAIDAAIAAQGASHE